MCDIITTIQDAIHQIEEDYHVKVIYAIECGSRLWGFSAANSDYDVRFVYVKPKEDVKVCISCPALDKRVWIE